MEPTASEDKHYEEISFAILVSESTHFIAHTIGGSVYE